VSGIDSVSVERRSDEGQCIYTVKRQAEVIGFIAIDSTIGGRARGGLRLLADVSEEEVRAAARTMTLKYGLLGLPQGGGKAGVRGDGEGPDDARRERLAEFARAIEPLLRERRYVPDPDLGTRAGDIRWMLQSVGMTVHRREWQHDRSGFYTAVSCLTSAVAAREHQRGSFDGCQVAIEGFGAVGSALADLLSRRAATVVAVSTSRGALYNPQGLDVPWLLRLASEIGSALVERYEEAERLPREALLELPVDLLAPCARYHSVHAGNVARVAASMICGGANDPLSADAERMLFERGVLYLPDFVTNCGGVLGGTLEFAGVRADRITALVERHTRRVVQSLLHEADRHMVPVRAPAEQLALSRHERIARAAQRPSVRTRALSLGLECYRRGWLPTALVASLAPGYIERQLLS
jgi:glutamate dehydrogenase (NAD(P)+)